MPIRFQVDADFYDHPKTIGMSDSATALWTRAGSYSAAKLLDGFVPESVVRQLSTAPDEAASELVRRGLWRKVRGGYRFHQWKERGNLTREQVEQERSADRQRKRRQRQTAKQIENGQVEAGFVRPDSEPDSGVTPDGIRGLSVSVSESVSPPPQAPLIGDGSDPPSNTRRKRRTTKLPDNWTPTSEHIQRAHDLDLDLQREVEKFRAHAEANDRRQANWNGAFTQWLLHADEYRRQRAPQQAGPKGWWDA